jgi:hypothetical protein
LAGKGKLNSCKELDLTSLPAMIYYPAYMITRKAIAKSITMLLLLICQNVFAADVVTLTILERANVARINEPVTSGVPLPRSLNIRNTTKLRLVDSQGSAVPAQFTPLARWGAGPGDSSAPIKWLLVDFQCPSLRAKGTAKYILQTSGAQPTFPILQITESAVSITITTGVASFTISKKDGRLGGTGLKAPLFIQAIGGNGKVFTTSGSVKASISLRGKMRVSIKVEGQFRDVSGKKFLDYTNWYWFYAGQSYARLFHTIENNTPGPIDNTGQISCYDIGSKGSVDIRDVSVVIPTDLSGAVQYSLGGEKEVSGTFQDSLLLYQDSSGLSHWNHYKTLKDWDNHPLDARPRMQAYVSYRGYKITSSGKTVNAGLQAQGWLKATDSKSSWAVAVRDFWQNFPKALRFSSGNQIQVGLFPDEYGPANYSFCLRSGEHKTHEILLYPSSGSDNLHKTFSSPLYAKASTSWYLNSGVLGPVGARNYKDWPHYEKYIDYQLTTSPDYENWFDWFPNIFACLEGTDFYGVYDYGDVPLDYEGYHVAPMNLKYNMDYGMWVQWLRGGDSRYFNLAQTAGRHIADIDILHTLHKPRHWSDGIMFGHSYHDEEGFLNPHRNYGGASCDLASGTFGMFMTYYLTGYEKAYQSAVELADCFEYRISNDTLLSDYFPNSNHQGFALMEWIPGLYATQERPAAHCLNAMIAAFTATAKKRYLKAANAIVGWADPVKQPYIHGPTGTSDDNDYMSPQFLNYYCKSLGLYLDMLNEFKLQDKHQASKRIVTFQNFIRKYVWLDDSNIGFGPRAGYPYRWYFDSRAENREPDLSSWLMLGADAMALAYKYSNEKNYFSRATVLFRTGSIDPFYEGDANTYTSTKEMANALVFGNNFIYQWARK